MEGHLVGLYTLFVHLISPRCGDSGYFLVLPCHVMSHFGLSSILVRIITASKSVFLIASKLFLRLNETTDYPLLKVATVDISKVDYCLTKQTYQYSVVAVASQTQQSILGLVGSNLQD